MSAFPYPYTLDDANEFLARATSLRPAQFFGIEADELLVGGAGLEPCSGSRAGVAILGYWLSPSHWGRGIASDVVRLLVARGFSPGFKRIEASVFAPNAASARVLEKCGFALEGRLRSSYVDRDGKRCDELVFGRVADAGDDASRDLH